METSEGLKTLPSVTFETQSGDTVTYNGYEWHCVGRSRPWTFNNAEPTYAILTLSRRQLFGKRISEVRTVIHAYR